MMDRVFKALAFGCLLALGAASAQAQTTTTNLTTSGWTDICTAPCRVRVRGNQPALLVVDTAAPASLDAPATLLRDTAEEGLAVNVSGPHVYARALNGTTLIAAIPFAGPSGGGGTGGTVTANQGTAGASPWPVSGTINAVQSGAPWSMQGNVAGGTTDSGNSVKMGCVYSSTLPTYTAGQRTDCQAGPRGGQYVTLISGSASPGVGTNADSTSPIGLQVNAFGSLYNGTAWDMARSAVTAKGGTGTGVAAALPVPVTSDVGVPTSSTTNSVNVFKSSPTNLYGYFFQQGGTAGYFVILNATTAPAANATITPFKCYYVPINGYVDHAVTVMPERMTAGTTFVSSTSCTQYVANTPLVMTASYQ